ncbi:type II toxin-antitoxin system prevent-host-death family antitoxin [Acidithiobacillus thiooxidans]|uniref:Antitoxin n=1 Tax=Acidithiobacillus thiooxidans ATCC 19377 TaxID=637390 RepID=A0A5P9XRK0_ACITH|nr:MULTISPECIES: type II toxin-antitoxin system prevent-host-death family antitoxin [Acidithiobacillus]MBU2743156.1 type II toxin-antitoxin system prevent-host-death family antitoxin [Acidithiobacillus albertensis]MBU2836774.1 type II toxin-antitoxin system prevent-host-death family antitoxin [Acidithiobacillus thiooxidans]MDA8177670.1 type II toxin-antitoxin system prevent-host-death family antitoxin [Acidithiobacillus sp.]QFX96408.1 prevent-host-death protein [Acidithiobacillus thiooxidans AT
MEISIREFRAHLAQYLSAAQQGQTLDITSHHKPVARVIGIPSVTNCGITRLLASDMAQWQGGKPLGASICLSSTARSVSEIILEDRG